MNEAPRTLLVGIGSPTGDDRLGWQVVELLEAVLPESILLRKAATPVSLLDWLEGIERLVICDACIGAGIVGSVHRWQWPDFPHGEVRMGGSHDANLFAVCKLAEELNWLPAETTLWGVEIPEPSTRGQIVMEMSPASRASAELACRLIAAELAAQESIAQSLSN